VESKNQWRIRTFRLFDNVSQFSDVGSSLDETGLPAGIATSKWRLGGLLFGLIGKSSQIDQLWYQMPFYH
jgi:hypothetical protein